VYCTTSAVVLSHQDSTLSPSASRLARTIPLLSC
jgi:hypothetical protein